MARVSEKNPRYRSKDVIAHDLAFILNAPLSHGTKTAVLRDAAWVWTEYHGKYNGCPYWSVLARRLHKKNPAAKFRHEHAVPKSVVINMLMELQAPTPEQVRDVCERFLIGVVVTELEDQLLNLEYNRSMPPEFYDAASPAYHDPWLRYKKCSIKVDCKRSPARESRL